MAEFLPAYRRTVLGFEKGYNPGIGEKETYMGIDRGANPNWSGWHIIDNIKKANPNISAARMNMILATNKQLQDNIISFFKAGYWDTCNLDKIADQQLANNIFDCSVNQGSGRACRFMQIACNYVIHALPNDDLLKKLRPLVIDGQVGIATISAFNALPPADLNKEINSERDASYRQDKGYSMWGKVWEHRLTDYIVA